MATNALGAAVPRMRGIMRLTCTHSCDGLQAGVVYDVARISEFPDHYMARRQNGRWPRPNERRFGFHLEDPFPDLKSSARLETKSCGYTLETVEFYGIQVSRAEFAESARRRELLASTLSKSRILTGFDMRKRLCDGTPLAFAVGVSFFALCQLGSTRPVDRAVQHLLRTASLSPRRIGYWCLYWWKPLP